MSNIFFAMMGWCGTKWPGWWWPGPKPGPDPEPWWRTGLIGIVGGVLGAVVTGFALGADASLAFSTLGALAGGNILNQVAGGLMKN
jgi:hypothetical protein